MRHPDVSKYDQRAIGYLGKIFSCFTDAFFISPKKIEKRSRNLDVPEYVQMVAVRLNHPFLIDLNDSIRFELLLKTRQAGKVTYRVMDSMLTRDEAKQRIEDFHEGVVQHNKLEQSYREKEAQRIEEIDRKEEEKKKNIAELREMEKRLEELECRADNLSPPRPTNQ